MTYTVETLNKLVENLSRFPGIGEKTARKLAFYIIKSDKDFAEALAQSILAAKTNIKFCSICCNLTDKEPCAICSDTRRDSKQICIISDSPDLHLIEKTGEFKGHYHVLHGVISPINGVNPQDLKINELFKRISKEKPAEVILALPSSVEGEATSMYIAKLLKNLDITVTKIASGIPVGAHLEFIDCLTLKRALSARTRMTI